jgi:hypothetical protein
VLVAALVTQVTTLAISILVARQALKCLQSHSQFLPVSRSLSRSDGYWSTLRKRLVKQWRNATFFCEAHLLASLPSPQHVQGGGSCSCMSSCIPSCSTRVSSDHAPTFYPFSVMQVETAAHDIVKCLSGHPSLQHGLVAGCSTRRLAPPMRMTNAQRREPLHPG